MTCGKIINKLLFWELRPLRLIYNIHRRICTNDHGGKYGLCSAHSSHLIRRVQQDQLGGILFPGLKRLPSSSCMATNQCLWGIRDLSSVCDRMFRTFWYGRLLLLAKNISEQSAWLLFFHHNFRSGICSWSQTGWLQSVFVNFSWACFHMW